MRHNIIVVASRVLQGAVVDKAFSRNQLNGEWFKLTPNIIRAIRSYDVVDDRFDELFDFSPLAPDNKDIEILNLKAEIEVLRKKLNDRDVLVRELNVKIKDLSKSLGPHPEKQRMKGMHRFLRKVA